MEQRQTVYLEADALERVRREAQDRGKSFSSVLRQYIAIGLEEVRKLPSVRKVG